MEPRQSKLRVVELAQPSRALPLPESPPESLPAAGAPPLESAFRQYASYVAAIALRVLGRDDEVDDVVQDVFLSAVKGADQLRQREAFKAWLATVTVRVTRRRLRMRRLRSFCGLYHPTDYENVAASGASPEDRAFLARVYRILDTLPVEQRIAWALRHVNGDALDAIAQACGCSLATVKRRIAAAQAAVESAVSDV